MDVCTLNDLDYITKQSSERIDCIVAGMSSLINDVEKKSEEMESQEWYQRMIKTITGSNKATKEEIQKKQGVISVYLSEAIAELYNRNCIDEKIIVCLAGRINEVYYEQVQLKSMLGAFVSKLNEKIESVDGFHLLETEIEQGVYSNDSPVASICKVISQMDDRTIKDKRKVDVIHRSLQDKCIISNDEIEVRKVLCDVADISMQDIGYVYLMLDSIPDNIFADLMKAVIVNYHFLPDMDRKLKSKSGVVDWILNNRQIDGSVTITTDDLFNQLVSGKAITTTHQKSVQSIAKSETLKEAEDLFLQGQLDKAYSIFKGLANDGEPRAMYYIGLYYQFGLMPLEEYDNTLSVEWYEKGKDLQDPLSTIRYCSMVSGIDKNNLQGVKQIFDDYFDSLYDLAVQDDSFAQYELGKIYCYGLCEKEINIEEGIKWLEKSSKLNNQMADGFLTMVYLENPSYVIDSTKATRLALRAANKNCSYAPALLACTYIQDNNLDEAEKWIKRPNLFPDPFWAFAYGYVRYQRWEGDQETNIKYMKKIMKTDYSEGKHIYGYTCMLCFYPESIREDGYKVLMDLGDAGDIRGYREILKAIDEALGRWSEEDKISVLKKIAETGEHGGYYELGKQCAQIYRSSGTDDITTRNFHYIEDALEAWSHLTDDEFMEYKEKIIEDTKSMQYQFDVSDKYRYMKDRLILIRYLASLGDESQIKRLQEYELIKENPDVYKSFPEFIDRSFWENALARKTTWSS